MDVFSQITQGVEHDIYVVLRHTTGEKSHFGKVESDFQISKPHTGNVYICELPSVEPNEIMERYLIPVGPTDIERECAMASMFQGVFTAISMMKASLRHYDYVMKTRTDYLPSVTLTQCIERCDGKLIVDGCANWPHRYPDRFDILWQGSLNDIFCFASTEQFLKMWDFEHILGKVWTGIPETTLFRAAMIRFLGDEIQSPRRNESFLKKYFTWDDNNTKQSFHVLRSGTALVKPDEATYFKGDEVVKYFLDKERVAGKIERAKLLEGLVPEIVRAGDNFFVYKYVQGTLLSDADVATFGKFLEFMQEKLWRCRRACGSLTFKGICHNFYHDKAYTRLSSFLKQTGIQDKTIKIDGVLVPSASDLLEDVDWKWLCEGIPAYFHGDPQPENVLVTDNGFCLLDWREDFGGSREYGDVYYDLAKIYHALVVPGKAVRDNKFKVMETSSQVDAYIYTADYPNFTEFEETFETFVCDKWYDMKKIKLLSALIYLNIATLHQEPYNRFLYYFGRYQLNESLCH